MAEYVYQEYPKWVHYRGESKIVNSEEEEKEFLASMEPQEVSNATMKVLEQMEIKSSTIRPRRGRGRSRDATN